MSVQNLDETQQSTKEQAANRTSEDRSFSLSRRNVMKTGAAVVAATAVSYAPPLVRMAHASPGLSPGFASAITGISDTTPTAGDTVTITGFGFAPGNTGGHCMPCFGGIVVNSPNEITAQVMDVAGTFTAAIGVGTPAIGFGTIDGGVPPPAVTGVGFPGFGAAMEIDAADINPVGPTVTITGSGSGTQLPVSIVGGQICIDFNPFGAWPANTTVETEFHFDTDHPIHCDYWDTDTVLLNAGSVATCAGLMGIAITGRIAANGGVCSTVSFSVIAGVLKIFFPGANITSGHPANHVRVV